MDRFYYTYAIPENPNNGEWEVDIFRGFYDYINKLCDYPSEKITLVCSKYTAMVFESLEIFSPYFPQYIPDVKYNPIYFIGHIGRFLIYRNNLATLYNNVIIDNRYCVEFRGLENSSLFGKIP
jgi:hypothetical protein